MVLHAVDGVLVCHFCGVPDYGSARQAVRLDKRHRQRVWPVFSRWRLVCFLVPVGTRHAAKRQGIRP
jgi:hypothetical protein